MVLVLLINGNVYSSMILLNPSRQALPLSLRTSVCTAWVLHTTAHQKTCANAFTCRCMQSWMVWMRAKGPWKGENGHFDMDMHGIEHESQHMRYAHCAASTAACVYDVSIPTFKKLYIDNNLK
jgi:hypothetical protein